MTIRPFLMTDVLFCLDRYLVVLRMGGVYTDSDVECQKPLDDLIQPSDALIAGWEAEFPNATIARISEYARKRQVAARFDTQLSQSLPSTACAVCHLTKLFSRTSQEFSLREHVKFPQYTFAVAHGCTERRYVQGSAAVLFHMMQICPSLSCGSETIHADKALNLYSSARTP